MEKNNKIENDTTLILPVKKNQESLNKEKEKEFEEILKNMKKARIALGKVLGKVEG